MAVGSYHDRAHVIRTQYLRPVRRQGAASPPASEDDTCSPPHRDERETRIHRVQKSRAAARLAPVMADLENIGMERRRVVREQPLLLRPLGVAHEEHADVAESDHRDDAGQVGIGERRRPRRVRREKGDRHTVDRETVARMRAHPANVLGARDGERRLDTTGAAPGKPASTYRRG